MSREKIELLELMDNTDSLGLLRATQEVLYNAQHLSLNPTKVGEAARVIKPQIDMLDKNYDLGLTGIPSLDVQLVFVHDTVNFCFWAENNQPKWQVEWPAGSIAKGGWYGLLACFDRAHAHRIPMHDAYHLANLDFQQVKEFFKGVGGVDIPLAEQRLIVLREAGQVLLKKYKGEYINLIRDAGNDATWIAKLTARNFSSFADVAHLGKLEIPFLKRAQLLANDLSYVKELGITGRDKLTAFADYKIPQMLRLFGILEYSPELAEKVDNCMQIPKGSQEEIEIRSAAIWGVELIRQNLGAEIMAAQVDNALWKFSQNQSTQVNPYHRTYTIYY